MKSSVYLLLKNYSSSFLWNFIIFKVIIQYSEPPSLCEWSTNSWISGTICRAKIQCLSANIIYETLICLLICTYHAIIIFGYHCQANILSPEYITQVKRTLRLHYKIRVAQMECDCWKIVKPSSCCCSLVAQIEKSLSMNPKHARHPGEVVHKCSFQHFVGWSNKKCMSSSCVYYSPTATRSPLEVVGWDC